MSTYHIEHREHRSTEAVKNQRKVNSELLGNLTRKQRNKKEEDNLPKKKKTSRPQF